MKLNSFLNSTLDFRNTRTFSRRIGLAAPILLVLLRIVQCVAVSGETAGSILMIAESMPRQQRGFWTSFALAAGPTAILVSAAVIGAVQKMFGNVAFIDWAWRIPFLLSALLLAIGYWTRRRVEESAAFVELVQSRQTVERAALGETCRNHWRNMFKSFFLKAAENTFLYLFSTFLIAFATSYLKFDSSQALAALMRGSGLEVMVILLAAYVSDRVGRRPVLLTGLIGGALAGCALFTLSPGSSYLSLQLALIVCLACHGIIIGPMAAYLAELFPTRIRYTALSTSYQLASVVGGAVAPLIGTVLLRYTGSAMFVAVYAAGMAFPALISVFMSKETRASDLVHAASVITSEGSPSELPIVSGKVSGYAPHGRLVACVGRSN